jgi:malonyl-CoA O-methyltransferase
MTKSSITEKQFSRAAITYDENADIHKKVALYLISQSEFPDLSGLVLDIGSGTGIVSERLLRIFQTPQIVNVDIAYDMLLESKKKNPSASLIQANMVNLPFVPNYFNNITSSMSLQWIESPDSIAKIISNNLKNSGYFALAIVLSGTFNVLTSIRRDILGSNTLENLSQAEKLPTFEKLNKAFINHNLNLLRSEKHIFTKNYNSIDEPFLAIKNLGISGSSNRRLSSEELQMLKSKYANYCNENNLPPYLDYKVGFFWGKKN